MKSHHACLTSAILAIWALNVSLAQAATIHISTYPDSEYGNGWVNVQDRAGTWDGSTKVGIRQSLTAPTGSTLGIVSLDVDFYNNWDQQLQWDVQVYDFTGGVMGSLLGGKTNSMTAYSTTGVFDTVSFDLSASPIAVSSGQQIAFVYSAKTSINGVAYQAPLAGGGDISGDSYYLLKDGSYVLAYGTGYDITFDMGFDTIPEPMSLGLLGLGCATLLIRRKRA